MKEESQKMKKKKNKEREPEEKIEKEEWIAYSKRRGRNLSPSVEG